MLEKTPEAKLQRQELFLKCVRDVGTIRGACESMGLDESTVYKWRHEDNNNFSDKFSIAKNSFADKLENMALLRVEQQKPSDNPALLITLLNGNIPEKYRPNDKTVNEAEDEGLKALKDIKRNYHINKQLYDDGYKKALEDNAKPDPTPTVVEVVEKPSVKPKPFTSEQELNARLEAKKKPPANPRKLFARKDSSVVRVKRW